MTVKSKIQAFLKLMNEHSDFGAQDSEPQAVFYNLIGDSFTGKDFPEDFDSNKWQLYSSMEGCDEVANELTAKYRQLHDEIQEAPHKEIVEASNYFGIEY